MSRFRTANAGVVVGHTSGLAFALLEQSGVREVEFEVDGSAKYAILTVTGKGSGTEQNVVKLPYSSQSYAKPGTFLCLSAQKTRVTKKVLRAIGDGEEVVDDGKAGMVHVLIRVNGVLLEEAESSAPFGIATASGKVPE